MAEPRGLLLVTGPMYSGKSQYLIERLRDASRDGRRVFALRHALGGATRIASRAGLELPALPVGSTPDLAEALSDSAADVVGVDELQFFDLDAAAVLRERAAASLVIVAGLDRDFRGDRFPTTGRVMEDADEVVVLTAVCAVCGAEATLTQRLTDGQPARTSEPTVLVEGATSYEPRCRRCHVVAP